MCCIIRELQSLSNTVLAGAMVPFSSQEDVDFFSHLELHLRQEHPPLAGRDHMAFRGSSYPVRLVQLLREWKHCMHDAAGKEACI